MRLDKLSIAAWILSLATDPTRAATTVGDFSEESAEHGKAWFWRQIARTLGAHIVHDFVEAPLRLLLSAIVSLALGVAMYFLLILSTARLLMAWFNIYYSFFPIPSGLVIPEPPGQLVVAGVYIVTAHIALGACMARISRHPLASWLSWAMLCTLLWISFSIAAQRIASYPVWAIFLVLPGVIWQRRRFLRTT